MGAKVRAYPVDELKHRLLTTTSAPDVLQPSMVVWHSQKQFGSLKRIPKDAETKITQINEEHNCDVKLV